MYSVRFDAVSKDFRQGRPRFIKEALLGSQGHRRQRRAVRALRDVSFTVPTGEAVALLGHNGSGKSTVLKLLARVLTPTSGTVATQGRIAPLLQLGSGFHPDLTGAENIFLNAALLGIPRSHVKSVFNEIINFAEIGKQIDTPVRFYSSGMYARLGFAIAAHVDPDILLIDEVLAVGDTDFQKKSRARMGELKAQGKTVMLVTHSFVEARNFCDRALVLSQGRVVYDGPMAGAQEPFESSRRGEGE